MNNPAINNVLKSNKIDDLDLQKYLSAASLLQDSIQNNLDLIVTDDRFREASIRRILDTKYPTVMKKPKSIDVAFEDKAKFDVQNPAVGYLFALVNENF